MLIGEKGEGQQEAVLAPSPTGVSFATQERVGRECQELSRHRKRNR